MSARNLILPVLALGAGLLAMSAFTVREYDRVVMFRLGEIVRTDFAPGLHFKLPLIHSIRRYDGRLLSLDAPPERYLTSEKKNVIVDAFIKWRIADVSLYHRSTRGDERAAAVRLSQIIKDGMKSQLSSRTIQDAVTGARGEMMDAVRAAANTEAAKLGIEVVDVRIKRIDLPSEVSDSVYRRMEKERATVAKAFRSRGEEQAKKITADAERQREEILANAYAEAQAIRGEGDAEAARLYAEAYNKDRDFFEFYRSLEAYRKSFTGKDDVLVLQPDSEFFRYFGSPAGSGKR
ncbi:MAG: protease modulator HflC [Gammaproteobacteria bacterium]|nr:protease modulator HflC [Gammaproteobacteria bacterium]